MLQPPVGDLIMDGLDWGRGQLLDDLELDLHPLRADALDVHGYPVPGGQALPRVGQAGEVGGQLDEAAVVLHRPHHAPDRLPGAEAAGVLHPGAQQLPVGQGDPPGLPVQGPHRRQDLLPLLEAVPGVGDAGDGDVLDGQHGHDAAAHVHEDPEALQPGHPAREDGPGLQMVQEIGHGLFLGGPAGEERHRRALLIGLQGRDGEAGGLPHPGEDGDVPVRAADPGGHGLLPGNAALDAAQVQVEGVVHAAALDGGLEDFPGFQGLPQAVQGEGDGRAEALRRVQFIFRHDIASLSLI